MTSKDGSREARKETSASDVPGKEYLAFTIGREEYGIDILTVQEIRGYDLVTRIAGAPAFIKGVINLRGEIVPIVDMRIKLGLDNVQYDSFTVVIVLNIDGRVVGMVVDGVSDVLTLHADDVRPAPELGSAVDTRHIVGLGTIDDRMLILLDIASWMSSGEMALRGGAGAVGEPAPALA